MKENLIVGFIIFVLITLIMYINKKNKVLQILGEKTKKKKKIEIIEFQYLISRHDIKEKNLYTKKIILLVSAIDAFIMSITYVTINLLPLKIMYQLMIGFVILFGLIYSIYEILGRILVKKGYTE